MCVWISNQSLYYVLLIVSPIILTESIVAADPVLRHDDYHYNTVEEEFSRSMERSIKYVEHCKKLNMDLREKRFFKK